MPNINLSRPARLSRQTFQEWQSRFRNGVDRFDSRVAWETLLKKGCKQEDLDKAFFYAVDCINRTDEEPAALRQFEELRGAAVEGASQLSHILHCMNNVALAEKPFWLCLAASMGVEKEVGPILCAPQYLQRLQDALNRMKVNKFSLKSIQTTASEGEVCLQLYVECVTGDIHRKEVSLLLKIAADAYGRLKGWKFDEGDVAKRFSRFSLRHPEHFSAIRRIVHRFLEERPAIDVISYYHHHFTVRLARLARKKLKAATR